MGTEIAAMVGVFVAFMAGLWCGRRERPWREPQRPFPTKADFDWLVDLFNTPHGEREPDPFADERPTENGVVTEVKRPVFKEVPPEATDDQIKQAEAEVAAEETGAPPAVGSADMTLEERADALRVHIGHDVTVVKSNMGGTTMVACKTCNTPMIEFSREEGLELVAHGDAVGTVVAV